MISRKSTEEVKRVIVDWASEHGLKSEDVMDLVERLRKVPANKSYRDTLDNLLKIIS